MKKNHDPKFVVIDVHQFDWLVGRAGIGCGEVGGDLNSVMRHVRKFNSYVGAREEVNRAKERHNYRRYRDATIALLNAKTGQEVYLKDTHWCYVPVKLIGRARDKTCVRIAYQNESSVGARRKMDVFVFNIAESIPEGWKCEQRHSALRGEHTCWVPA